MLKVKYLLNKFTRLLALVIVCNSVGLAMIGSAQAERRPERSQVSDFGLPTHRRDGGSRGSKDSCVANVETQNLMALIPQQTVGRNASASPKLFFYVPESEQKSTLEFVLRNEEDKLMYEAFLSTEGNGIMSVEVPADVTANLLEKENYHWYLSMICDSEQRSRDIVVEGWMRQEAIDLATQQELDTASSLKKAEVYQEQGFWFNALSALAENPDALQKPSMERQKWSEMLSSVGLKDLASEPFIETEFIDNPAK